MTGSTTAGSAPRACSAGRQTTPPDRLTRPLVREGGDLVEADWDAAMDRIVERTRRQLDTLGPGSIGFYTSGQLFCEEYYTLAAIGMVAFAVAVYFGVPRVGGLVAVLLAVVVWAAVTLTLYLGLRALLAATPIPDPARREGQPEPLRGEIPSPLAPPPGCRFHTRCPLAQEVCRREVPPAVPFPDGVVTACHFAQQVRLEVSTPIGVGQSKRTG